MLAKPKIAANIASTLGFALIITGRIVRGPRGSGKAGAGPVLLVVAGGFLFAVGCWNYAKSKGHCGAWGLPVPAGFGLIAATWLHTGNLQWLLLWTGIPLTVVGLLLLAFLPDKHMWGQ